jgi:hypothetical protein
MTDRIAGFIVTFESNLRADDAADLFRALKQLKCVLDVRPVVADPTLTVAEARARRDMQEKFYAFYCETFQWETSQEGSR